MDRKQEVIELLKEYKQWQKEQIEYFQGYYVDKGYVFTQDNGNVIHPDSITDYFKKFSKKYALPHINPHAFRHTMASILFYNGVDSVSISSRLGHAQVSTTANIYAHVIEDADSKNAAILSKVLNS
jgi:integrase